MFTKFFCGLSLVLFLSMSAHGADGDNAAELYRAALKATPVSAEDLATYSADKPAPAQIQAVLGEGAEAIKLLHEAAGKEKCDWNIDPTDKNCLAFLDPIKSLSDLVLLQVDADIAAGKKADAATLLSDKLMLARRIEGIGFVVTLLMGQGVEYSAINQAAGNFPSLDDDAIASLNKTWTALPQPAAVADAIARDKQTSGQDLKPGGEDKVKATVRRTEVIRALFAAALQSPHGGAEDFASSKDPEGGKPFDYRPTPNGYELSSAFEFKGNAVTLTIGKSDAEK